MKQAFVIALDQGTTSSRAALFDREGQLLDCISRNFQQIYPRPGWVEHNPQEILFSQLGALSELVSKYGLNRENTAAIGIDNQRETTIVWDPTTGEPIANALVWQCRRTAEMVRTLCGSDDVMQMIQEKTGLLPDAYFSATKLRWLLDNVDGARRRAEAGELLFGTVDTWLIWVLTGGLVHATDPTNASRTLLYNIHEHCWDQDLLKLFDIPASVLPEVRPSASLFGETSYPGLPAGIPLFGVAGDQQAALFGQCCFDAGEAKCTYGTGSFLLMNTGKHAIHSQHKLVTTIAAAPPNCECPPYALEGSAFVAGALIQWLRDELHLIRDARESEYLAQSVSDTGGVYIVPAFTGLGAPWWDPDARGIISGLTRGTSVAHIVRAALEAMAYQSCDLVKAMEADAHIALDCLTIDGGAAKNNFLAQFQADMLQCGIRRPQDIETSVRGAAYLAGLGSGFWSDVDELRSLAHTDEVFAPQMSMEQSQRLHEGWKRAVKKARL